MNEFCLDELWLDEHCLDNGCVISIGLAPVQHGACMQPMRPCTSSDNSKWCSAVQKPHGLALAIRLGYTCKPWL